MSNNIYSYIHIPFCEKKCKYCRFASLGNIQKLRIHTYCEHLNSTIKNMDCLTQVKKDKSFLESKTLETIYFGGGTPGVLESEQIYELINNMESQIPFSKDIEISLETTPNNVTVDTLNKWNESGVNRVSIGVQSLNEKSLQEIGRGDKGEVLNALDNAEKGNITNISIDFIIGLPHVKKGEIQENIEFILDNYSCVKHISVYMLEEYYDAKVEEGDSKYENITYPDNWKDMGISEDHYAQEYLNIVDFLAQRGFMKYEISNFAKAGYECKHNKGYWSHQANLAFGLGAHGYLGNARFAYSDEFGEYYNNKLLFLEEISSEDIIIEKIMFGLRTSGIDKYLWKYLDTSELEGLIGEGYIQKHNEVLRLTNKGVVVMDYILGKILL